ncbi:cystatin-A-like [Xenopus laevis]|uniref:Cystatin-A-like n=1 Tax=Xenopus laevis TaxID=8355 RepID=A0A8J1M8G7_XENLA|nr:cystatin-A-like [Xenopus laevis]
MSGITRDGGLTATQKANAEVQNICDHVKAQFIQESGVNVSVFKAIEYREQVVAGTNYFIKVHITGHDYVHLRVYRSVENSFELTSYQLNKKRKDELIYF